MSKKITFLISIIGLGIIIGLTVFFIGQQVFGAVQIKSDINMNSKKITGLPVPISDSDVARKKYVDSATGTSVAVHAYRSGSQSIAHASNVYVKLNAEQFDVGNNFNTTSNRFTAPATGYYYISGSVYFPSMLRNAMIAMHIVKNGLTIELIAYAVGGDGMNATIAAATSRVIKLNAGDYLKMRAYQFRSDRAADNIGTNPYSTYFSVYKI